MEFKRVDAEAIAAITPALDRLADEVSKVMKDEPKVSASFVEEWPVFGSMTMEAFNAKWSGRRICWKMLPGGWFQNEKGNAVFRFGNYESSDAFDLCSAGAIMPDEHHCFSHLSEFGPTTHFPDPRTPEEHLAVFDRFMPLTDMPINWHSHAIWVHSVDGETYLSQSFKPVITSITAVKADDMHYQTILVEDVAAFSRYEWNGNGFDLVERTDIITHENLDRLRDSLTDVKYRRLVAKFIGEGCPDCRAWVDWINDYGPWRGSFYDANPRSALALKLSADPHDVLMQRFYYYGEQHSLGNSMRKEIDKVKRLLGGEVIHSN